METLENRTHGGAGAVARMWHGLCQAVRSTVNGPTYETKPVLKKALPGEAMRQFLETKGLAYNTRLPEGTQRRDLLVVFTDGKGSNVYLDGGERLCQPQCADAIFAKKVFTCLEKMMRNHRLSLAKIQVTLVYWDGGWMLSRLPDERDFYLRDGSQPTRETLKAALKAQHEKDIKAKNAA